jgi:hypothetical protein
MFLFIYSDCTTTGDRHTIFIILIVDWLDFIFFLMDRSELSVFDSRH